MSYLDCCEKSFQEYRKRVSGADYKNTFQYLSFHTPFGGMVKGAHRTMMRKLAKAKPQDIEADFQQRVPPGIQYCQRVGNIMGPPYFYLLPARLITALLKRRNASAVFHTVRPPLLNFTAVSFCRKAVRGRINFRSAGIWMNASVYRWLIMTGRFQDSGIVKFGTRNAAPAKTSEYASRKTRLMLTEIKEFHRKYEWTT